MSSKENNVLRLRGVFFTVETKIMFHFFLALLFCVRHICLYRVVIVLSEHLEREFSFLVTMVK